MAPAARPVRFAQMAALLHATLLLGSHVEAQDIISDITVSAADERLAMETKAQEFWRPILTAAEDMRLEEHMALYTDAEKALADLPPENVRTRELLKEALARLKVADARVLALASDSSQLAGAKLAQPVGHGEGVFSFLTGGQGFISQALSLFADGGRYSERLVEQIGQRQGDILPLLRGAASNTGDVLANCRLASERSFDLLKYDLYERGVPKTPQAAKAVAHRLASAAGETRHRYMRFVTRAVRGVAQDMESRHDTAAATVARSSISRAEAQPPTATFSVHVDATLDQVINL